MNRLFPVVYISSSVLCFALFVLCLFFNGYYTEGSHESNNGLQLLIIGWLGIYFGVFAWLGNPLLLAAWLLFLGKQFKLSLKLALFSLGFMLTFLLHGSIVISEQPSYAKIIGYGLGYWLWVTSAVILSLGSFICMKIPKNSAIQ